MKRDELEAVMDAFDLLDTGLIFHAYRSYMRDYELIVVNDGISAPRGLYSYVFRYCVEANTQSCIGPTGWLQSLDDRLTDYETYKTLWDDGVELDGFVWGVKWSECYPGWSLVENSKRASYWTDEMGFDFYEILIQTNAIEIRLIFSDLIVTLVSDELPAPDEASMWLNRFGSAPAPSPSSMQAQIAETSSRSHNGTPLDEPESIKPTLSRTPLLWTMSFHVLLDGDPVGFIQPVGADQSAGVIVGRFTPLPAYERVRDQFQRFTAATRFPDEVRRQLWEHIDHTPDLTVITAGGRPVPIRWLQVFDTREYGPAIESTEAEFGVTMDGFFDDSRFWSGWR